MAGVLDYVLKIQTLTIHGSETGLKLTRPLSPPQVATQLSTRIHPSIQPLGYIFQFGSITAVIRYRRMLPNYGRNWTELKSIFIIADFTLFLFVFI